MVRATQTYVVLTNVLLWTTEVSSLLQNRVSLLFCFYSAAHILIPKCNPFVSIFKYFNSYSHLIWSLYSYLKVLKYGIFQLTIFFLRQKQAHIHRDKQTLHSPSSPPSHPYFSSVLVIFLWSKTIIQKCKMFSIFNIMQWLEKSKKTTSKENFHRDQGRIWK